VALLRKMTRNWRLPMGLRHPVSHVYIGRLISCRSFSAKEPLIIGLFCGKWRMKKWHPVSLRHPVSSQTDQFTKKNIRVSDTGWRRTIGCLKLQVISRKRATNYRALLRKMTYEYRASFDSTPPCTTLIDQWQPTIENRSMAAIESETY